MGKQWSVVVLIAVLAFVALPLFAGFWQDPALVIALPFALLFGAIVLFNVLAWAARKLHL